MSEGQVIDILREGMLVAFKISAPILIVSIVIGLVISIFQAATQIHEQTLTFVPKVIVTAIMFMILGSWMISVLSQFMLKLFSIMAAL